MSSSHAFFDFREKELPTLSPVPYERFKSFFSELNERKPSASKFWATLASACEVFSLRPESKLEGGSFINAEAWISSALSEVLMLLPEAKPWSPKNGSVKRLEFEACKAVYLNFVVCLRLLCFSAESAFAVCDAVLAKKYHPQWLGLLVPILHERKFLRFLLDFKTPAIIERKAEFKASFMPHDRRRDSTTKAGRQYRNHRGVLVHYSGYCFQTKGEAYSIPGATSEESLRAYFKVSVVILSSKCQAVQSVSYPGSTAALYLLKRGSQYQNLEPVIPVDDYRFAAAGI